LATSTAGVALAAYVARAGLPAYVVAPENAPETYIQHRPISMVLINAYPGCLSCTPSKAEWMKRKPGLFQEVHTQAAGLRMPSAIGDRLILQAAHESEGTALAVTDDEGIQMVYYTAQREGMLISLEATATVAAYHSLLATHFLEPGDEIVLFFTGYGLSDMGNYSL